jgi:hypothetical protein
MKQIEHIPGEKRQGNGIWWLLLVILILCWAGYFWFHKVDVWSLSLGGFTMTVLVSWAVELTGNKVPESWRRQPDRR